MISLRPLFLAFVLTLGCLTTVSAKTKIFPGPYSAEIYYITDGDTFFARVALWPGLSTDVSVRIRGIDTPESWRPKCKSEKAAGKAATVFLMQQFNSPHRGAVLGKAMAKVTLKNVALGKYSGRVLADVQHAGEDIAKLILSEGHGRKYAGGKRQSWC